MGALAMQKDSPKFGALRAALAMMACATATACNQNSSAGNAVDGIPEEPVLNLPAVSRPAPPMDRAALLAAVARAASEAAAGRAPNASQRELDGRPFELRIRFGCGGPASDLAQTPLGWTYEAETRTLRVHAAPTISAQHPLLAQFGTGEAEAVEGFWIPRPWMLEPLCPASLAASSDIRREPEEGTEEKGGNPPAESSNPPLPTLPLPPLIGIAQFFTATDPRISRRDGRAYESVRTVSDGQEPGSDGFVLVLSGRLRAFGSMGVIGCAAQSPDAPPECIISADFDRVWIEEPRTGREIAEWSSS